MSSVIWISYTPNKDQINPKFKSFTIDDINIPLLTPRLIKETILSLFGLDLKLSARLRRKNGNLLPVNQHLPINRKKTAYELEVFLPVINKRALSKFEDLSTQELRLTTALAHKTVINHYLQRIIKLESTYEEKFKKLFESLKKVIIIFSNMYH